MANTAAYQRAEKWVRENGLGGFFPGHTFSKQKIQIGTKRDGAPAFHEFDAVSEDKTIVVSIKASSGRTSGGRSPIGQIMSAYAEAGFLSRVEATTKALVFTERRLLSEFSRTSDGKISDEIHLEYVDLPQLIADEVRAARGQARLEQGWPAEDAPRGHRPRRR